MSKHPAIYLRVSTDKQDDGASLDTQEEACRVKLRELGYQPDTAVVYRDVHTGVELFERPELTRLREAMKRQQVAVVVCHALDRLSRTMEHASVVFVEAQFHGVTIEFATDHFEATPEGMILRAVQTYAGQVEYASLVDRARRGHQGRVRNGKPTVGIQPPYGLRWADQEKSRFEEDPETGPVLRRIFNDLASGISGRRVASNLTAEGIPSPRGLEVWSASTISKLSRNSIYWTGARECFAYEHSYEHVPGEGRKKRVRRRAEGDEAVHVLEGVAPILVDPVVAQAARDHLANGKQNASRKMRDPEGHILRGGFARCGYCGHALGVQRSRGNYTYYYCSQRTRHGCPYHAIAAHRLEDEVWDKVRQIVNDPEWVREQLDRQQVIESDPTGVDLERVERLIKQVRDKQQRLVRRLAIVDDDVAEMVAEELDKYTKRARELEDERDQLVRRREYWQASQVNLDGLEEWCAVVADRLNTMDYYQKRDVLTALGVQVTVWKSNHSPRFEIVADPGFVGQRDSRC